MLDQDFIGLYEIASLAEVTPSAVANWRKRFPDFPTPIADLKSGPVFQGGQVKAWLAKRQGKELQVASQYYDQAGGPSRRRSGIDGESGRDGRPFGRRKYLGA